MTHEICKIMMNYVSTINRLMNPEKTYSARSLAILLAKHSHQYIDMALGQQSKVLPWTFSASGHGRVMTEKTFVAIDATN